MPTIDIDGRGKTPEEAVEDMWARVMPLEEQGYHAVSSVEIVDMKSKKVVENFLVNDPEWRALRQKPAKVGGNNAPKDDHKPPKPHEYAFKARVRLEY